MFVTKPVAGIEIDAVAADATGASLYGFFRKKTTAATAGNPRYTFFGHDDSCWDRGLWLDKQRGGAWQTTGGANCGGPQNTGITMSEDI